MRRLSLAALFAAAALAGCESAPTTARAPADGARMDETNQPPVAVITKTPPKHIYTWGVRYYLSSASSYDPDGTIASYFWANDCPPKPEANTATTSIDIYWGETCRVSLELWDNLGAFGMQEITLSN
ncbi:MAG: hypothetical protein ACJ8J0_12460 [Longimicrobiaceae bacterium]